MSHHFLEREKLYILNAYICDFSTSVYTTPNSIVVSNIANCILIKKTW